MAREIVMPKLGLTMSEGTITRWYLSEGDSVSRGDKIMSIETDKITNDVESDVDGVLRLVLYNDGDSVAVKEVVAIIADEDEDISMYKHLKKGVKSVSDEAKKSDSKVVDSRPAFVKNDELLATPYAKHLSDELGIELNTVVPTGYNGVIVARDVELSKQSLTKMTGAARNAAAIHRVDVSDITTNSRVKKDDVLAVLNSGAAVRVEEKIEVSNMRKSIAENMISYWQNTPMVTFNIDVNMDNVIGMRDSLNREYANDGVKISYNHIIAKALSKLLLKHKSLNAYFDGSEVEYHNYVNIGIAVAIGDGLVVPNLKNSQNLSLVEIAIGMDDLIERARVDNLDLDEVNGGTFTITNLGVYGLNSFSPIINKPESAILGVNSIRDELRIVDEKVVITKVCTFSLTADHSLVDGKNAGAFLKDFKKYLENPFFML